MSQVTASGSHAKVESPAKPKVGELIAELERSIMASDARISGHAADLKRAAVAQAGKLLIGSAVAAAVTGVLIWRPWQNEADRNRRRRQARRRKMERQADREFRSSSRPLFGSRSDGVWSVFNLISLLWPLLPFKLTSPVGPKMTAFLMGLGVPITAKSAAGEDNVVPPPMVEADFDPVRYFGRWYEVARLPLKFQSSCAGDVTATYAPVTDGSGLLSVINACRSVDGGYEVAEGVGKLADPDAPAKLKVTFAPPFLRMLPFVWADYWVLQVDADYGIAVVGTPDRKNLWFLSREPSVDDTTFEMMRDHAVAQGYDLTNLIHTVQTVPVPAPTRTPATSTDADITA